MANFSPPQQQPQLQSQQQQQQQQPRSLNPPSIAFVPGGAWGQPNTDTVLQPAPPQPLATSADQSTIPRQLDTASQAHPRSDNVIFSRLPTASSTSRAPPSWADFKTHIKKDDKEMVRKAQEVMSKLGGEGFRPELRETYNDRRGGREITVREKSGGVVQRVEEDGDEWKEGSDGGVRLR